MSDFPLESILFGARYFVRYEKIYPPLRNELNFNVFVIHPSKYFYKEELRKFWNKICLINF